MQMCFLRVSDDVCQQKPYAGLLALDNKKYQGDKILSGAHPKMNL